MSFWTENFWTSDFWTSGFWASSGSSLGTVSDLAAGAGDGLVNLSWSDVEGETGYDVHRSTTSPVAEDGTDLLTAGGGALPAGTTSYQDATAVNDTTYFYKVSATDGSTTTYSNEVNATPSAAVAPEGDHQGHNVALTLISGYL